MAEAIDKKYLAGLVFKTSKATKVKGEDGERVQHRPLERQVSPADVLDWKDNGRALVIVTADGQKHTVDKKTAEKPQA